MPIPLCFSTLARDQQPPQRRWLQCALGGFVMAPAGASAAWPARAADIIVPFPPGGGDLTARIAARFQEKHLPGIRT